MTIKRIASIILIFNVLLCSTSFAAGFSTGVMTGSMKAHQKVYLDTCEYYTDADAQTAYAESATLGLTASDDITWDIMDEPCSSFRHKWIDGSSTGTVTAGTGDYAGSWKFTSAGAGNYAKIYSSLNIMEVSGLTYGETPTSFTLELKTYFNTISYENTPFIMWIYMDEADTQSCIEMVINGDGASAGGINFKYGNGGASSAEVGSSIMHQDTWQTWRFIFSYASYSTATVDVWEYVADATGDYYWVQRGDDVSCGYYNNASVTDTTEGRIIFEQDSSDAVTPEMYISEINISSDATPNNTPSAAPLLDENCSDIYDWTNADVPGGLSEVSPAGQLHQTGDGLGASHYARITKDIGDLSDICTLEFKTYVDEIGHYADVNRYQVNIYTSTTNRCAFLFADDGIYSAGSATPITGTASSVVEDTWQTWRICINTTTDKADIYVKNGTAGYWSLVASQVAVNIAGTGMTDGLVLIQTSGYTEATEIHMDYIKIWDNQYLTPDTGILVSHDLATPSPVVMDNTTTYPTHLYPTGRPIELSDGSILAFATSDYTEISSSGYIIAYRSTDGGTTWDNGTIWQDESNLKDNGVYPLYRDGEIYFFYNIMDSNIATYPEDNYVKKALDSLGESCGEGSKVNTDRWIREQICPAGPIIKQHGSNVGRVYLPVYGCVDGADFSGANINISFYYTDDSDLTTATWHTGGVIEATTANYDEANFWEDENGDIEVFMRRYGTKPTVGSSDPGRKVYHSVIADGGITFSAVTTLGIDSPNAYAFPISISTDEGVLVWNDASSPYNEPRDPLTIATFDSDLVFGDHINLLSGLGMGWYHNHGSAKLSNGNILIIYGDALSAFEDWWDWSVKSILVDLDDIACLKVLSRMGSSKTATKTLASSMDISSATKISFKAKCDATGTVGYLGIHDSGGTWTEYAITISSADTWETTESVSMPASADADDIDSIRIRMNTDEEVTLYINDIWVAE